MLRARIVGPFIAPSIRKIDDDTDTTLDADAAYRAQGYRPGTGRTEVPACGRTAVPDSCSRVARDPGYRPAPTPDRGVRTRLFLARPPLQPWIDAGEDQHRVLGSEDHRQSGTRQTQGDRVEGAWLAGDDGLGVSMFESFDLGGTLSQDSRLSLSLPPAIFTWPE